MRPVISRQGIVQRSNFLLPRRCAVDGIHANAHDLGILGGKLRELRVVGRHLLGSNRRPVERVESYYHIALAVVIAQPESLLVAPISAGTSEFGGGLPTWRRALPSPP